MALAEAIRPASVLWLDVGQTKPVEVRLLASKTATKLRIRVTPNGVSLTLPDGRSRDEASGFLDGQRDWVAAQMARLQRLRSVRRVPAVPKGEILYVGQPYRLRVIADPQWRAPNQVSLGDGEITIRHRPGSATPPAKSLENWLRKEARNKIEHHLAAVQKRLKRTPGRVYVMGQRTKWGSCSALGNLSFNWRLVMAPDEVMRYLVTHEVVHLAVPDHSAKFWLTVQSLCPTAERSRQWLAANAARLLVPLNTDSWSA